MLLTVDQLRQIAPNMSARRAQDMTPLLNELCPTYGIDNKDKFEEFLAQVLHESGEFRAKTEDMNYSAKRLREIWPKRFPSTDFAKRYEYKPVELANFTYGGRMGNDRQGDGWRFRGGGFIGLTGKSMYAEYTDYVNKRDRTSLNVGQVADLIRANDRWALDSALWFFCVKRELIDEAVRNEMDIITYRINGGFIGKKSREEYYEAAKRILV